MDLLSGSPFWPVRNGLIASYPPLEQSTECDVAVIGGGITGACIAHELAAAGCAVVVVDRRDIGMGSTAGSTSLLQYELDVPMVDLATRVGEQAAVRSYRLCADALERLKRLAHTLPQRCGFHARESLYGASRQCDVAPLRAEYLMRRRHGFAVEFWDRARVKAASTLPFRAALVSRPAAEVDAHALTHGLLQAAGRKGTRIFDRTTVRNYDATRTGVVLHTDRGAVVRARRVVIAAGYEAANFVRLPGLRLQSTYALVSEPLPAFPGWPGRRVIWESARPAYFYLRTTPDNRAMFGGADEPFINPVRRDRLLPAKIRHLAGKFRRWLPRLRLEVAYAWAGTFAATKDGLPFIGAHPSFPRGYFALGYGGNGITFSLVAAEIIRDLCVGQTNADAALFRLDR
ncbi:MAG TPA: FAD-dependent oxidoreductase [Lacunisphaera sp.]|nr:FAD-dependent oxidoreductase [Lacunisphaera sp.]